MSTPQNALPWATKLFTEFMAIYGSQKVAAMWADTDVEAVKALWESQIRRQSIAPGIAKALQHLIDSGSAWPPTLPEFVKMCADFTRHEALMSLPGPAPDRALGRDELATIMETVIEPISQGPAAGDPLYWAKAPKSAAAVRAMLNASENDPRFRELIRKHLRESGAQCRGKEAVAAILRIRDHQPRWMLAAA